jgi:energy-coupling factor transporter ATP-binding protein EcfA2
MTSDPIIRFEDLSYRYTSSETAALLDVELTIFAGEYVAVIGASGAGKTSLCLALTGIIPNMTMGSMTGRVVMNGQDTADTLARELARTVGIVFDNPEFQLSQTTVMEEVALGLENLGVPRAEMLERIAEALGIVGLRGLEERSPLALSGGQQQRLAIAAALAMDPRVLVLDEPTSNLDPIGKEEIFSVAADLQRERGMTIVIAEHEIEVMALYADRVVVMDGGRIAMTGTPRDVFREVEALESVGVRAPQVTQLAYQLEQRGEPLAHYPSTLEEAVGLVDDWERQRAGEPDRL